MKISQKIFTLAAAGTLFAGTALAEPFSQQSTLGFPAETQGISHIDIDALNAAEIGKIAREQFEKNLPQITDENQQKLAKIFLELIKKATSITAGNLDENQAILYVRGNVSLAEIVKQLKAAGTEINSVPAGKKSTWNSLTIAPDRAIVLAQIDKKTIAAAGAKTEADAKKLISKLVKNRKAKTTAKVDFKAPKPSIAFVNSKIPQGENAAGTPGNLPAERVFVNLAETAGTLKLMADLTFPSDEMAQMMHMQLAQLVPLAPMMITANPALASQPNALELSQKIAAGTSVTQNAKTVNISAALPVELLKNLATAVPASVPAADDDVFGE